jgi:HEPN domain-containing protein
MERESRARKNPNYDALCFHAQQRAEKYPKARLSEAEIAFGKVHDLVALSTGYIGPTEGPETQPPAQPGEPTGGAP